MNYLDTNNRQIVYNLMVVKLRVYYYFFFFLYIPDSIIFYCFCYIVCS